MAAQTLMLFVDGLGWGVPDPAGNPLYSGACPNLAKLLENDAQPIDAHLGIPGAPQSATGQAALLTGQNAPVFMGRHVEGLPGPRLKELVAGHNILRELARRGYRAAFANAYYTDNVEEVRGRRRQSVTTVAALSAGAIRTTAHMVRHEAVYQDLTRESLRERGYEGPLVTPAESARDLRAIAAENDFTLFEYFQTDRAGHSGDPDLVRRVLGRLDELVAGSLEFVASPGRRLILTSDHGNIEDPSTRGHTGNPVPFIALGAAAGWLKEKVRALTDIAPALLEEYPPKD